MNQPSPKTNIFAKFELSHFGDRNVPRIQRFFKPLWILAKVLKTKLLVLPAPKFRYLALLTLLLVLLGAFFASRVLTSPAPNAIAIPINPTIEERWGIRVTQIGVTADGGLVDFRYVVIDPDKALAMLQDVNNLPVLIAEDSGMLVNSAAMMSERHSLQPGRTYFLLYRNTRGAIKHGSQVSVVFGSLRLEHFATQ